MNYPQIWIQHVRPERALLITSNEAGDRCTIVEIDVRNRLLSRVQSTHKQEKTGKQINKMLKLKVIEPLQAPEWSQKFTCTETK